MATNGDPVLAEKVVALRAKMESLLQQIAQIDAIGTIDASQQQERDQLSREYSSTESEWSRLKELYENSVPIGETPKPIDTGGTDTTSSYAEVIKAVSDRDNSSLEWEESSSTQKQAQDRINEIKEIESIRPLNVDEQREISNLNLSISNARAKQDSLRSDIENATTRMNESNSDISSTNNASPRIINETTYNNDGTVNIPSKDKRWNSDISDSQTEGVTDSQAGTITLNTPLDLTQERQETYNRIETEIEERQKENANIQSKIDNDKKLLDTIGDTPGANTRIIENRINRNLQKQQLNSDFINSRTETVNQMKTTDLQRQFANDDRVLDSIKEKRQKFVDERWQANQDLIQSRDALNAELAKENPDPVLVEQLNKEVENNTSRISIADAGVRNSERDIREVAELRNNPDYFAKRLNEDNSIVLPSELDKPIDPIPQNYGAINSEDRDKWNDGEVIPPDRVWDTETAQFIDPDDIQDYDGSGLDSDRYVNVREGVDADQVNDQAATQISSINDAQDNEESQIESKYNSEKAQALNGLYNDPDYIDRSNEASLKEAEAENLKARQDQLDNYIETGEWDGPESTRPNSVDEARDQRSLNEKQIADAEDEAAKLRKENQDASDELESFYDDQKQSELQETQNKYQSQRDEVQLNALRENNPNSEPLSSIEAQAMVQRKNITEEDVLRKEANLERAKTSAQQRCRSTSESGTDCTNPENWTEEDKNRVDQASNDLDNSKNELRDANESIASGSAAEGGEAALLEAGLTPEELEAAQNEALNVPPGRTGDQTSPTGNDSGDTIRPQNVGRSPTGFESINNGAPFYLQMPTLTAISDFRMKNGYSPYGPRDKDAIARDAVHFNIFELNPQTSNPVVSPDGNTIVNEVQDQGANTIGTFTVYPNEPNWLNLAHNHTWGSGMAGKLAELAQTGLNFVDAGQSLLQATNTILGSVEEGGEVASARRISRKIDTIDTYQSTSPLEITLPFVLFTKKDFLADVYRPLMFLTALTYPKRLIGGNIQGDTEQMAKRMENYSKNKDGSDNNYAPVLNATAGGLRAGGQVAGNIDEAGARTGGFGPFRYFVTRRPEYLSMRHSSGLIYFPICYIQSIDYKFLGPWYNYDGTPINVANTPGGEIQAEKSFRQVLDSGQIDPANPQRKLPAAYPSMAEVKIVVKNAMPFFRDDWIQLFNGANDPQNLINISVKQTGQGNLITPSGRSVRPLAGLNETEKDLFERTSPQTGDSATEQNGRNKGGSNGASTANTVTNDQQQVKDVQATKETQAKTDGAPPTPQQQDPGPTSIQPGGSLPPAPPSLPPAQQEQVQNLRDQAQSLMDESADITAEQQLAITSPGNGDLVDEDNNLSGGADGISDPIRKQKFLDNESRLQEIDQQLGDLANQEQNITGAEVIEYGSSNTYIDGTPIDQFEEVYPTATSNDSELSLETKQRLNEIDEEISNWKSIQSEANEEFRINNCSTPTQFELENGFEESTVCSNARQKNLQANQNIRRLESEWKVLSGQNHPSSIINQINIGN